MDTPDVPYLFVWGMKISLRFGQPNRFNRFVHHDYKDIILEEEQIVAAASTSHIEQDFLHVDVRWAIHCEA